MATIGIDQNDVISGDAGNNILDASAGGSSYHVLIDNGAIKDLTGNAFAGISDAVTLDFGTPNSAPVIQRPKGISFAPQEDYAIGGRVTFITTADFNGDGYADIATANYTSNTISILINNGNGTFILQDNYVGHSPYSVIGIDVNSDGHIDLVTANSYRQTMSVMLNNGNGTFSAMVDYATDGEPWSIISADINGDGKPDIIIGNFFSNTLSVFINNGDGTFADKVDVASAGNPDHITSADINGDGKTDLIIANYGSNSVSVLLNNGDGTFADKVDYVVGTNPQFVTSVDVNGDNMIDIVVATSGTDTVSVLLNNGAGTFADKVNYTTGNGPLFFSTANINSDGKIDLIVPNYHSGTISILLNNGDGSFADKVDYAIGNGPHCVVNSDINLDGKEDIIIANYDGSLVSVLLNTSPSVLTDFTEQTPVAVCNDVIITDPDGDASWNGGSLDIQITANAEAADRLTLPTADLGNASIWCDTNGNKLMAGTTEIGTADSGSVSSDAAWHFTFNANVNNALVQAVARALTFNNSSDTPSELERTVTFTAVDNLGASTLLDQHITVTAVDDNPDDTTAPTLISSTPSDNATSVAIESNIVLTFSEDIQAGTGNIVISNGSDTRTIAINDTSQITVSGNTVTINPINNLHASSNYHVAIDNNAVTDLAGNSFVGIRDADALDFTVLSHASIPGDNSNNSLDGSIEDDTIYGYRGNDTIYGGNGNDIIYGNGDQAIYHRPVSYSLSMPGEAYDDNYKYYDDTGSQLTDGILGNNNYMIEYAYEWIGWRSVEPVLTFVFDHSITVDDIVIGFNRAESSLIYLPKNVFINENSFELSGNEIADTTRGFIDFNGSFSGSTISITLQDNSTYRYIFIDEILFIEKNGSNILFNSIVDNDTIDGGNGDDTVGFSGNRADYRVNYNQETNTYTITDTIPYRDGTDNIENVEHFLFADGIWNDIVIPKLISATPADDTMSVSVGSDIVLTFSENVQAGSGNIVITDGADVRTIAVTDSTQVTFDGSTVTINPATDLHSGSHYHVEIGNCVIKDLAGNAFAGISDATTLDFGTSNADPIIQRPTGISFAPQVDYAIGGRAAIITSADFNEDGYTDIATANYTGNTVSILMSNGDGTFILQDKYVVNTPFSVISTDVNSDGHIDLVTANSFSPTMSVMLNNGNGTFSAMVDYTTDGQPWPITSADINGDGKVDIITGNFFSNTLSVFINNGDGTFADKVDLAASGNPDDIKSTDINGDGKTDLIIANYGSNSVSVLLNNGDGTFIAKVDYDVAANPQSVTSADLNGDSKIDLIVANRGSNSVSVLINKGDGTFAAKVDYDVDANPEFITSADVNGDGKEDIVASNYSSGTISILLNNGDGTFADKVDFATGNAPECVTSSDVNHDGKADIIIANYGNGLVSVLLNTSPSVLTDFTEQTPVAVCNDVIITDPDGDASWNGGSLDIQITANAEAADRLTLPTADLGNASIWFNTNGNKLMAGTTEIGMADAGSVTGDAVWHFTFNANVTNALVQAVARSVMFNNSSDTPSEQECTVTFTVTDNLAASAVLDQRIVVTAVDDNPADITPPLRVSATPSDNATAVALDSNIVLTFNENVQAGTGNIVISNGTDIRAIDVTDSGQVSFSGHTVTINPTEELYASSTYSVQMASGVIKDLAGNAFAGISNVTTFDFTTNKPPADISLSNTLIPENSLPGTVIGILNTVDDVQGTFTYQLLDDAGGRFVLLGDQIKVADGAVLDFETTASHTIRVSSTDQGGLSFEKNISITLADVGTDLLITQVETPQNVVALDAGSSLEISWSLITQGSEPVNASWIDRVYLDNPDTPGLDRWVGDFPVSTQLPLSVEMNRIQTIYVPADMQGHYRVVVITDAGNALSEGTLGEANNSASGSEIINIKPLPNPNLQIESITAPFSAYTGREIEVQWVVKNTGNAATSAPFWYDRVYLSADTKLDNTDVLLNTAQNPGYLNIGEGYTNTAKVTLPDGREGDYHILVQTDAYGHIPEGDGESDNVTASSVLDIQPIPLRELSDLAVVSVAAPAQALSGQSMSLTYSIENAGQEPLPNVDNWIAIPYAQSFIESGTPWIERIFMSTDTILDSNDYLLKMLARKLYNTQLPLPNNASAFTTTETVTLPVGMEGNYYFFVTVESFAIQYYFFDPILSFAYTNRFESNDKAYDATPVTVHLTPPPDLEVSGIVAPSSAIAGHNLTITYRVINRGSTTTPNSWWSDVLYLSNDTVLDSSDMKLADLQHSGTLEPTNDTTELPLNEAIALYNSGAAAGYYINSITLRLADGLQGNYYLIASTDSKNDVFELDNENNIFGNAEQITIESRPADLIVNEASAPTAAHAGTNVLVSWHVTNQAIGTTTVTQWYDRIILSQDTILGNSDDITLASFTHTGTLNSSQMYSRSELVSLPAYLSGQYRLFVVTDANNYQYEANHEDNNSKLLSDITIIPIIHPDLGQPTPTADLQVTSVTAPASAASGDWFTVSYTVINAGLGRTNTEYWRDEVMLSKDDVSGNADDINLGSFYHANQLAPTGSYQGSGSFRLPIDLQGDYYVWVRTDAGGVVAELEAEGNNQRVADGITTISLTPTSDLVISALQAADQGTSGQNLQVDWTVHNNGAATSGGWRQAFYLSRDGVLDRTSDLYLGYKENLTALSANADVLFSESFLIPKGISGKYYVFGVVDSNNAIYERGGEGNNTALDATVVQITLPKPADLVAGVITVPENGIPGAQTSISYTVTNQSEQAITGQWSDSLYISPDAVWDLGDALFSREAINGPLAGNASYSQTATGSLPGIIGGDYYVIVRSDIFNQISESNESNNLKVSLDTTHMDVEALALGTPDSASFAHGDAVYYRVDIAAGETLRFNFDRAAAQGRTELFVSYDAMPSRYDFDYRYNQADSPDQNLVIANTKAGSYYVMAYNLSGATDTYSITADTLHFSITELGTTAGSNKGQVTVRINGAELTTHTAAMLVSMDGVEHAASQVYWKDSTELWATFDLRGLSTETYDVKVQDGARTAFLNDSFTVNSGEPGHVEYSMETPSALRTGQVGTVRVYYQNIGDTDVVAPLLTISGNALLKLPEDAEFGGASMQLLGINNEGPAGILSPGAEGSFQLFFKPNFSGGGTVNLGISSLQAGEVIDWNTILDASKPDNISLDAWATVKANLIAELGVTSTDYQNNLAENATYLDQLETRTDDVAKLFSLEYLKATDGGALLRPSMLGALGYSHTFAWEITAARQSDGSVIVDIAGTQVRFEHTTGGSYTLVGQGSSTLTETGGAFEFHQQNGTSIAFNLDGNFAEIHDSNNHNVQATYNGGHLTNVVADNGDSLSFIYNNAGRLIQQTDLAGRTVSFSYDANNQHLTSVTTPDGTTEYGYVTEPGAARHQVSSITLADGTVQHFEYNAHGQLIKESVNNGAEAVTYSYVGVNEVIATDATGTSDHLWLNENGQFAQIEDALGNVSQLRYDANGNLTGIANADGTATGIEYDAAGNPLSVQDALGHSVDFAYETQFGQLAVVTDQRGNAIDYGYDSHGNLNKINYADGSSETYNYDTDGDLNVAVNRRGESVTYTFDDKGQLTQKSYADGSTATYSYDAHGNLTSALDADSSSSFQYDAADHLIKVTDGDGRWLSYTYDDAGRRTEMADQAGHVTHYSYDDLGHLSQLTDGTGNLIAAYSYDAAGRLSHGENGNGTYTTYQYDLAGQLTHLVNFKADGTVNSRFDYTYDEMGRRTDVATLDGTTHYNYDAIGQLTGVTLPDGHHIEYHYDAAGNRAVVNDGGTTTNYATNALNQYTNSGNATYSYDADGNMTGKTDHGVTTTYGYDAESHLVSVATPTDTWSYEYDALGNRIASVHNGERIEYQLDPTGMVNVAGEYNSAGDEVAQYTYGIGLESQSLSGSNYYYDFNDIGSTAGLTGSTGAYVNQYSYLPYGENLVTTETVANSFEYVGQWGVMDAGNGLDFMRARFYNEEDGRFLQQDPIGVNGGLNLYGYTLNAPINYSDPTGYVIWSQAGKGALAFAGGLLSIFALVALAPVSSVGAGVVLGISIANNLYSMVGGTVVMLDGLIDKENKYEGSLFKDIGTLSENKTAIWVGDVADNVFSIVTGRILGTKSLKVFEWGITKMSTGIEKLSWSTEVIKNIVGIVDNWSKVIDVSVEVIAPRDPNDIVGPKGFGDEHWTNNQTPLSYIIHYENQSTATAPAQQVTITQTLDSDLNLSSFRLGNFGWGDISITVPDNTSFYIDRLDLRTTKGYMVDVVAGVDVAKHEAYWSFTTIDPNTGEIPEDPTIGFLPTNVEKGCGEGFVNYSIRANADAPTGTVIDAKATIVFTTQEPIDTPAISNTLDTQAPESHVETLANATVESAQFLVRWSGSDVGSAIAGYTVYVSDNGATYAPWLENTTLTEATYAGQPGHSYAFYTVASDNAGNKESAPAQADLTIQVTPNANLTDTSLPKIASVELPDDGNYTIGQALDITVHFTEKMAVDIAGLSPVINLTLGEHTVNAVYQSGSGTNSLVFRHIVADPTYDFNHTVLDHAIQTNGTTLRDIAGNPLVDLSVTHNLSGSTSFWKNGKVMHGITVNMASHASQSDAEGKFSLPDLPVGTNMLTSTVTDDSKTNSSVDLSDAIAILKSIVGLTSLESHQQIAADFDSNNGVDLSDAIGILKHIVGLPAPTPEWVFVDKSDTMASLEPVTVDLTYDTMVDLVGILRGDVDGSWGA